MQSFLNVRLTNILRQSADVLLKPLGFRKRGVIYRRQLPELWWLIGVQRSRWNTSSECEFTMNFGVYVPGMAAAYNRPDPKWPVVADCVVHARVGSLNPKPTDLWWTITLEDDAEKVDTLIREEISQQLQHYVLPFLHRLQSKWDVIHFLETLRPEDYRRVTWPLHEGITLESLAILYWLLGERERCREALEQLKIEAMKKGYIEGYRERVEKLYYRLCSS